MEDSRPSTRSRVARSVRHNAKEVIQEDYTKARDVALEAAKSRAWLYPIKGIFYFASHRSLWKPLTSRLPQYLSLYVSVIAGMFTFTYLPQLAVLIFTSGPLAVATTVLLVLNESAAVVNTIARNYLLRDALLDTFDGTLVARNKTAMVQEGREITSGSDPIKKLGKVLKNPFSGLGPRAIIRYIIYLPLNFIPVVGTVIFFFLQARGRGKNVHDRFFQLKKWTPSQRSDWLEEHAAPYTAFGIVSTLLEMIPVASIFFTYTNTVGAALWAADIEAADGSVAEAADVIDTTKGADDDAHDPQETGVVDVKDQ